MYLSDYHTHCSLSFDSKTPVEDMVRAGIAQGLQEMCLTDHVDLFRPRETARWEHDFSNREENFARADQAADGKIIVRRGIELGEAMRDFAYADELLRVCRSSTLSSARSISCRKSTIGTTFTSCPRPRSRRRASRSRTI